MNAAHDCHIHMSGVTRNIMFPYQLGAIGHSLNNPPVRQLHTFFPDHIELCLRLSGDTRNGLPVQTVAGKTYENIPYPHVLVKPPGAEYSFANFGRREVFYLIYPSGLAGIFRKTGIFDPPLCWEFSMNPELELMLKRISDYFDTSLSPGNADRIDILCFQLICELLLMKKSAGLPPDKEHELMLRIDSWIRLHAFENIEFETLARKFGLSRSSFFRYWKRYSKSTPAKYRMDLRLNEACRRLAGSRERIADIAQGVHLGEPAYMGMLFRQRYGMTPLEYRKKHSTLGNG